MSKKYLTGGKYSYIMVTARLWTGETMLLSLAKLIGCPGGQAPFSLELDFSDMVFGNCQPVTEPVRADGQVVNKAGVLLLDGVIHAEIHGVCDRCTREFDRSIEIPVHAVLETDPDSQQSDDLWTFMVEGDCVDLEEIIRTAFVLDMDSKMLCDPDCKGICFRCGADLNLGQCQCKPEPDPRFAVLKQLLDKQ